MRTYSIAALCLLLCSCGAREDMQNNKKQAALWYEAFSKNDPTILDRLLSEDWVDIPSPPGTPAGPAGVKPILARLKTTFPDLNLTIQDVLQDGNKVVVRVEMSGDISARTTTLFPSLRT